MKDEKLQRGDLIAVKFSCHQVSATRVLEPKVLTSILGTVTLPKGLDAMLRQQVLDRKILNPFGAIEKGLRDYMFTRSVSTELGFIVNPTLVAEVAAKLADAKAKYEEALPGLLGAYEDACNKQDAVIRAEYPNAPWLQSLLDAVAKSRPTKEYIEDNVNMEFFLFHVGQLNDGFDEKAEAAIQSGVVSLRKDLPGMAMKELAKMYSQLKADLDERTSGRIRQSTVQVALKGADKLEAVSFLDAKIGTIAGQVRKALEGYVRADSLTGADMDNFAALVGRLSSQRHLVRCLELGTDPTVGVSAPAAQGTLQLPQQQAQSGLVPVQGLKPLTPVAAPAVVLAPAQPAPAAPGTAAPAVMPAPTPMKGVAPAATAGLFG